MGLFSGISDMLDSPISLRIMRKGETITCHVLPDGSTKMAHIRLTGTAEELDEGFVAAIRKQQEKGLKVEAVGAPPIVADETSASQPKKVSEPAKGKKKATKAAPVAEEEPEDNEEPDADGEEEQELPPPPTAPKKASAKKEVKPVAAPAQKAATVQQFSIF